MSFFGGNSSRPVTGRGADDEDRSSRSETTFLGDAAQALPNRSEPMSRNLLDAEPRPGPAATEQPRSQSSSQPTQTSSPGPTPPDRCTNVIASGAKWSGNLTVDDSVRIEGNFSGEVRAKGTVHVSEGAQVDAKIRAAFVVVSGNFRGEIRCDQRVDLLPRSRVNGEVITKVLSVHEGATLDGRVQMTQGENESPSTGSSRGRGSSNSSAEERAERRQERAAAQAAASAEDNSDQ